MKQSFICGKCKTENVTLDYKEITITNGSFSINHKTYTEETKEIRSLQFFCPTCKAEIEDESFIEMIIR